MNPVGTLFRACGRQTFTIRRSHSRQVTLCITLKIQHKVDQSASQNKTTENTNKENTTFTENKVNKRIKKFKL